MWIDEKNIGKGEKGLNLLASILGIVLFVVSLIALIKLAFLSNKGVADAVIGVVFLILIIFSFIWISGRGTDILQRIVDSTKEGRLFSFKIGWTGIETKVNKEEERKFDQKNYN